MVLGGERGGVRIDGFDLGNSPAEYTRPSVGGKVLVFTTTNGTEAIRTALQRNTSRVQVNNGIPPSPLPQKAPRFQLVSPFKGSNLGALAAASGQSLQVPTCEGATLTANARDSSMGNYGEATTFFACLMPYQGGYSLNIYTTFTKLSGSVSAALRNSSALHARQR